MSDPLMEVLNGVFMGGNFVEEVNAAEEREKLGMWRVVPHTSS